MGLFDKLFSKKDKSVQEAKKAIGSAQQVVGSFELISEKIEELKEYLDDVFKRGVITQEQYDSYSKEIDELLKLKESKSYIELSIDALKSKIEHYDYLAEYNEEQIDELYDELVNYGNFDVLNSNTPVAMRQYTECRDRILNSNVLFDNLTLRNRILSTLKSRIDDLTKTDTQSFSYASLQEGIIRNNAEDIQVSWQKETDEFYSLIISCDANYGVDKINSCKRIETIRHAIKKLNENLIIPEDKKSVLLTALLAKKEELRQKRYGKQLKETVVATPKEDTFEKSIADMEVIATVLERNKIPTIENGEIPPSFTDEELAKLDEFGEYIKTLSDEELDNYSHEFIIGIMKKRTLGGGITSVESEKQRIFIEEQRKRKQEQVK